MELAITEKKSVKKLLDNAENMEDPAYGTTNNTITSFQHFIQSETSTNSNSEFSEKFLIRKK